MILTLANVESERHCLPPTDLATGSTMDIALSKSVRAIVNVRSVTLLMLVFWTMVSILMLALARGSKMAAATPGWSGTPMTVILATLASWAIPLTLFLTSMAASLQIMVPGLSLKLEATNMGTLYNQPSSTARLC